MLLGVTLPIVVFEVLAYACLGLCIWHALHQGPLRRARLIELGIGVLYGLTLETLTIMQLHVYQYGRFLIMLGPVPLAVAVGWGIILYSAMAFAESLAFPFWAAPALVGLLGLNIDLTMDAVAIRLNMWHWLDYAGNQTMPPCLSYCTTSSSRRLRITTEPRSAPSAASGPRHPGRIMSGRTHQSNAEHEQRTINQAKKLA